MTFSLAHQTLVFLESILLGVCGGIVYDICRAVRRVTNLKLLGTAVIDVIFWIIVLSGFFYFAVTDAVSQMRFYVAFGEISGMILYFLSFTPFFLPLFCFITKYILLLLGLPHAFINFITIKIHIFKPLYNQGVEIIKKMKKTLSFLRKSG